MVEKGEGRRRDSRRYISPEDSRVPVRKIRMGEKVLLIEGPNQWSFIDQSNGWDCEAHDIIRGTHKVEGSLDCSLIGEKGEYHSSVFMICRLNGDREEVIPVSLRIYTEEGENWYYQISS